MGQTASRQVSREGPTQVALDPIAPTAAVEAAAVAAAASATSPAVIVESQEGDGGQGQVGDNMAASKCNSVNLRQSVAKMRWTASSLASLKAAEDNLLVSEPMRRKL